MGLSARFASAAFGTGIALAIAMQASTAGAYGIKRTRGGDRVHWDAQKIAFEIDPSVAKVVPGARDAVDSAMGSWSGVAGAPSLGGVDTTAPDLPALDKRNTIVFKAGGYDPAGRALAITVLTYDDATGKVLDADVVVNGAYAFALPAEHQAPSIQPRSVETEPTGTTAGSPPDPSLLGARTFDFQHVLAHELGHSLGLSDEIELGDALMYRYSAPDVQLRRAPHDDDIAGLEQLYGDPSAPVSASGAGCGGATVSPKRPDALASSLSLSFALGLVAFLALRTRSRRGAAQAAVVASTAAFVLSSLPAISKTARGADIHGSVADGSLGHATARVTRTSTTVEQGIFRTHVALDVTTCRVASCPARGEADTWGGRSGTLVQIVGNQPLPETGDLVEVEIPHARAGLPALQALPSQVASGAMRIVSVR